MTELLSSTSARTVNLSLSQSPRSLFNSWKGLILAWGKVEGGKSGLFSRPHFSHGNNTHNSEFKLSITMGNKSHLSDFECGIVVGVRGAGLSILETADLWDFYTQVSLGFLEKGLKKRKYPCHESMPWRIKAVLKAKEAQPSTSNVYQLKWPVRVHVLVGNSCLMHWGQVMNTRAECLRVK